eukprot:g1730.t1
MPRQDHMVHRGHGVFDTATLADGKLYRLNVHLDRFLGSAERARIEPPLPRERMVDAIIATVAASGKRNAGVRYWLSAGPGDFSISPRACEPVFTVVVYEAFAMGAHGAGTAERTVPAHAVPLKPPLLAGCKSNNYLLNVLCHMHAVDGGGTFGIQVDADGNVAEGAIVNAAFVTDGGVLITPPFDRILRGCTMRRALELAAPGGALVREGLLVGAEQRDVPLAEAKRAREVILMGGDTHVVPVVRWDDEPVGDGEVGPVAKRLLEITEAEALVEHDFEVVYS